MGNSTPPPEKHESASDETLMELFLLVFARPRDSVILLQPEAWTGSYSSLISAKREVFLQKRFTDREEKKVNPRKQSRKRDDFFPGKSPNDQSRTSHILLTIDFLFSTNDLGGGLRAISRCEESTLDFQGAQQQDGGRDHGKRDEVGGQTCRIGSGVTQAMRVAWGAPGSPL